MYEYVCVNIHTAVYRYNIQHIIVSIKLAIRVFYFNLNIGYNVLSTFVITKPISFLLVRIVRGVFIKHI